jgi:UPF0716 protein FxsA
VLVKLLFLLVAGGLVELYLLLMLADLIGGGLTFLLVIGSGIVGAAVAQRQGLSASRRIALAMHEGTVPDGELFDTVLIAWGGILLLLPGVITDLAGLGLLLPPVRSLIRRRWLRPTMRPHSTGAVPAHDQIIDSYVVHRKEHDLG